MLFGSFRNIIIPFCLILLTLACSRNQNILKSAEKIEPLVKFESNELFGFKNSNGEIKMQAKFSRTDAISFENIAIVEEKNEKSTQTYYLTRSGKKLGSDQVYTYGYSYDCEREGHIRYKDPFTTNVGLFDSKGKIIIPAIYDDLSQVTYGLVSAIKNAEKSLQHSQQTYSFGYKFYRDHLSGGCNHISWSGGIKLLLDTSGKILVKNFNYKGRLDYSSLEILDAPSESKTKESFKGVNGKFYVFTNIEEDFKDWFDSEFLKSVNNEKFINHSMDSIMHYQRPEGWSVESKVEFFDKNIETLLDRLSLEKRPKTEIDVRLKELSPLSYDRDYFQKYYNNCNKGQKDKYPVLEVKHYLIENDAEYKTVLKFLKMEDGYKIFDIRLS